MRHVKYLIYFCKHKWFVLLAGLRLGTPIWQLLTHDLSKLRPSEWFAYANYFYGRSKQKIYACDGEKSVPLPLPKDDQLGNAPCAKDEGLAEFNRAWLHHQNRNRHHWQYWLLIEDENWWRVQSFDDTGPMFIAQNNKRFEFGIQIDHDDSRSYKELMRLVETLNARPIPQPMPRKYILEMVADWMGAGRAITGRWEVKEWYGKNRDQMLLHPDTREAVEKLIEKVVVKGGGER